MISTNQALDVVLFVAILIPSIVFHEVSHGWVASRFGDRTARDAGRLTLNPIPHIDPFGSLLVPGLLALSGGPVFGWAKPVPVNPAALPHPTRHMAVVALAGPATNLALAAGLGLAAPVAVTDAAGALGEVGLRGALPACDGFFVIGNVPGLMCLGDGVWAAAGGIAGRLLLAAVLVNIALAVFNLLPIPPLDGSKLVPLFLSERARITYYRVSQYGFLILFALIFVFDEVLSFVAIPIGWIMRVVL